MNNVVAMDQPLDSGFEVIQISDPHLFAREESTLLGVNTRESFLATVELIKQKHPRIDLIVVTGDISQDYSEESYQFFAQQMRAFQCPVLCLPGNHDEQKLIDKHLSSGLLSTEKSFHSKHWDIFLAHSQVRGKVFGQINSQEMSWLDEQLSKSDKPSMVFTHHHPVLTNTAWIDVIGIKNCEDFTQMLAKHEHLKICGFGHIHQDFHVKQAGVEYYSAPSTCVQFKPNSKEFAVTEELPGYRHYICRADGVVTSNVHRLEAFDLTLDMAASGY